MSALDTGEGTEVPANLTGWRAALNCGGGFFLGFVGVVIVIGVCWRLWLMPMFPELPNFAHAGGAIGDLTYVNGIDAFNRSYAHGFRTFEVDFERTSEGTIVCGHDWDAYGGKAPDLATFLASRAKMQYPVCTFGEMSDWFARHPDATLVSDAKGDVLVINAALRHALGSQLLAEAYSIEDVVDLAEVNRNPPILALYKIYGIPPRYGAITAMGFKPIHLDAVAMSVTDVWYGLALWAKIWIHAPVYVYTVNDCGIAPMLHALGADGVMTDGLGPTSCR